MVYLRDFSSSRISVRSFTSGEGSGSGAVSSTFSSFFMNFTVPLKAMKMHNTYRSPIGGTVARVHVAAGDVVAKGVLLLEFE